MSGVGLGGGSWIGSGGGAPSAPEIIEAASLAGFPVTGLPAHIYVAKDTNKIYRWDTVGLAYVELSPTDDVYVHKTGDTMTGPLTFGAASGANLQMDIGSANPAYAEGKVFYDNTEHALAYYNDASQTTVHLGQQNILRVKNDTGAPLSIGKAVYISGSNGNRPTAALAIASDAAKYHCVGLVVDTIPNAQDGYVVLQGFVTNINTLAYTAGDIVYLSGTVAGELTLTPPALPSHNVRVGIVTKVSGGNGEIYVTPEIEFPSTDALAEGTNNLYFTDARVASSPALVGLQNALTSIPSGTATSTTAVTSASTTFVDVMSTTVTLNQTTTIYGVAIADLKATTATAVAGFRVMINAVGGQTMTVNLADTTNNFPVLAQYFSATLTAGTYTVKAQMNRASGTGTVNFVNGTLWAQGQQSALVPVSPSRILYVAKNGGVSPAADGTWARPFSTISAAVSMAISSGADFNTPYAIAVAPGVGSTGYNETAPINVTKGGICVFAMSAPGYKGVQVAMSGNFVINMAGSNLFFALFGIEVNCPNTAAFTSTPAALYVTGTASQRVFVDSTVLNCNNTGAGAVFCDNPSATIQVTDSDVKAGTSVGPNIPAAKVLAGNLILKGVESFDRQSGNVGTFAEVGGGTVTIFGGNHQGKINKTSNSSTVLIYGGAQINSGSNPAIVTQASAGTGLVNVYSAVLISSASNVVTGGETFSCGAITYGGTGSGLDSALNGGSGPTFLAVDGRAKYYAATPSQWSGSAPANVNAAIDRLAAAVYAATGNTPIP